MSIKRSHAEDEGAAAARYGELAEVMPDHVYVLRHGHIYTTPFISITSNTRSFVAISITARRKPFYLRVGAADGELRAAVIAPGRHRELRANDVQYLGFRLNPFHPLFRSFRPLARTGLLPLDRDLFGHLDDALDAAYRGELDIDSAESLHDEVAAIAAGTLPQPKPMDSRVERILELLHENGSRSLDELSELVGLSYHRMSHLFADTVGMPIRSYCLWLKLFKVGQLYRPGTPLTTVVHEAGFTDSAHFGRVFQGIFGASFSYFRRNGFVRYIVADGSRREPMTAAQPDDRRQPGLGQG